MPNSLKVVLFPIARQNPYTALLSTGLTREGWTVLPVESLDLRSVADMQPEVFHLHWIDPIVQRRKEEESRQVWEALLALIEVLKTRGARIVWTLHNLCAHESLHPLLEQNFNHRLVRAVHVRVVHSESARAEAAAYFQMAPHEFELVPHMSFAEAYPNSISAAEARERLNLPEEALVILMFGQVRPYKGVKEMIAALMKSEDRRLRLLVAGPSRYPGFATNMKSLACSDSRIQFHNRFIEDEFVQVLFNAANVVALPYRRVLTSGVALLAMTFGRACLAPDIPLFRELLGHQGGVFYPLGRNPLEVAVAGLLDRKRELDQMGLLNKAAIQNFSLESVCRKTASLYLKS